VAGGNSKRVQVNYTRETGEKKKAESGGGKSVFSERTRKRDRGIVGGTKHLGDV